MNRNQREVESGLKRKGFVEDDSRDHKYFVYHTIAGKKTAIRTKSSHGGKVLDSYLISKMALQCCLKKDQFLDLVDCPMSRAEYEEELGRIGKI